MQTLWWQTPIPSPLSCHGGRQRELLPADSLAALLPSATPASSLPASPRALLISKISGSPLPAPCSSPARWEGLRAPGSTACPQFWLILLLRAVHLSLHFWLRRAEFWYLFCINSAGDLSFFPLFTGEVLCGKAPYMPLRLAHLLGREEVLFFMVCLALGPSAEKLPVNTVSSVVVIVLIMRTPVCSKIRLHQGILCSSHVS